MDWMNNNILRIAEVLEVHPESNSVSVRFVDDGSRIPDVPVMSSSGSTRTGTVDLPVPEVGEDEERDLKDTEKVYSMAVIAMTSTLPVCLGFLQPAVNELAFKDKPNLRIWRHASDAHSIVSDEADIEIHHPSGAYAKIGATSAATDLTEEDYDRKWTIRRNKRPVQITLRTGGSSTELKPTGEIDIVGSGRVRAAAGGHAELSGGTSVVVRSDGSVQIIAGGGLDISAGGNLTLVAGKKLTLLAGEKVQVQSVNPPTVFPAWVVEPAELPEKDEPGNDDDDDDPDDEEDGYWQWDDPTYGEMLEWWHSLGYTDYPAYAILKAAYYQVHERKRVWVPKDPGDVENGDPGWW